MNVHIRNGDTFTSPQDAWSPANGSKPAGVWYSAGGSWARFCLSSYEEWLPSRPHVWSLRIDKTRVRRLATDADTYAFRDAYVDPSGTRVRWDEVRTPDNAAATGLEINPYSYRFRGDRWYNEWDASSGVVWDTDAVVGCLLLATRCADGRYAVNGAIPGGEELVRAAERVTGLTQSVKDGHAAREKPAARRTRRTDHILALTGPAHASLRYQIGGSETRLEHARRPRGDG